MTFKMELFKALFPVCLVLVLIPEVWCSCFDNAECGCIPDGGSESPYPLQPIKWSQFENLFVEGRSLEYFEVYNLKPPGSTPDLSKLVVQWLRAENGTYFNSVTGWYDAFSFCYDLTIPFSFDPTLRFHEPVAFNFVSPLEGVPNIGTMFSSCPERYLINWYCPVVNFDGEKCNDGLQMSLTSTTGPENIPWHLVSRDMCRNNIPYIDDNRWWFTSYGPECELGITSVRKKRNVNEPRIPNWP